MEYNLLFRFVVLACFAATQRIVVGQIFSSMATLESLVTQELEVLPVVQAIRRREHKKIRAAREYVQQLRKDLRPSVNPKIDTVSNPVEAFHFIKRHNDDWTNSETVFTTGASQDAIDLLAELKNIFGLPNNSDIEGAALAFQRLQRTYKVSAYDFANGEVYFTRKTPILTAREAFLVGKFQSEGKHFKSAIEWLQVAWDKFSEQPRPSNVNLVEILDWLQFSVWHASKNASGALEISKVIKSIDPAFGNLDMNLKYYSEYLANFTEEDRIKREAPQPRREAMNRASETYDALCRGELKVAAQVVPHLNCYFETYRNPVLLLQPIKVEQVHFDPDIFLFHDLLREPMMEQIRNLSCDHLERSGVGGLNGSTNYRVSQIGWLNATHSPIVEDVNRVAGQAANLNVTLAERLQTQNYGLAGQYLPHYDYMFDPGSHSKIAGTSGLQGDRVATLMFYLTDVKAGGATVFPRLNLTIYPVKGAAAFWYNLHRDGMPDVRSQHSGCPVFEGSKWVGNKWFHEWGQERTRPCALVKDSPDGQLLERPDTATTNSQTQAVGDASDFAAPTNGSTNKLLQCPININESLLANCSKLSYPFLL